MKIIDQTPPFNFDGIPSLLPRDTEKLSAILSAYNGREVHVTQAVVTGQQLGFMGGPLYTILKGISCIKAARALKATPIFWLATEDHDIEEIDHTYTLDALGNIKKHTISLPKTGQFVEDLTLTDANVKEINAFFKEIGMQPLAIPSRSYAEVMTSFLKYLFRDTELLFIEPKLIRSLAEPFFKKEIAGEANLFYKDERGHRKKASPEFLNTLPAERLSPNVFSRPVMQSFVIPTLAYVAGPNEMRYYETLGSLHEAHGVPMPKLLPRMQATFIPDDAKWPVPNSWDEVYPELKGYDKKEMKAELESRGIAYDTLHRLHNLVLPKEKPQERVYNWFWLQSLTEEDLVARCLR